MTLLKGISAYRAVLLLAAGAALLFSGCQPLERTPAFDAPIQVPEPSPDLYAMGENHLRHGRLSEALSFYEAYVRQHPDAPLAPAAMDRMAFILMETDRPEEALSLLEELLASYPEYGAMNLVLWRRIEVLASLVRIKESQEAAQDWLNQYPDDFLSRKVLERMGDNHALEGEEGEAFLMWLKADALYPRESRGAEDLQEKIQNLISSAGPDLLHRLAEHARGTTYLGPVYYRLASLYREQGDFPKAKEAAGRLIQSSTDRDWTSRGNALMALLEEESKARPGAIGCLLPLSGPFAPFGEEVLHGIVLGAGLFKGSSPGPGFELVVRDTRGEAQTALRALEDLVQNEKVMGIIGPLTSAAATAVATKAQGYSIPIITLTQKDSIVQEGDMVFRGTLTPRQEVESLLEGLYTRMGLKRFAILYPDNPYGQHCAKAFHEQLEGLGGTVIGSASYPPEETDFGDQIRALVGLSGAGSPALQRQRARQRSVEEEESRIPPSGPEPLVEFDGLFIPDSHQRVAMIAPHLAFHDVLHVQLAGTSPWVSPRLLELAGEHVQDAVVASGFFVNDARPEVQGFVDEYRGLTGQEPGTPAATGHDMAALLQGILITGKVRTRERLREALLETRNWEGLTGPIHFQADGEIRKPAFLLQITGKAFVLAEGLRFSAPTLEDPDSRPYP